jgi:hypothetical protein
MFELESLEMSGNTYVWTLEKTSLIIRSVSMSFTREIKEDASPELTDKRKSGFLDRLTR